ncbi:MAG: Ig-like domain-containing protein [Blastocatellales bacterium]
MFSNRAVLTAVGLFRTIVYGRRRGIAVTVILTSILAFGAAVMAAKMASDKVKSTAPSIPASVPPASFAHFVTPASAALFDVSSTPVATVSAASFESVPVAPDAIVSAFGTQLASQIVIASDADPNTPGVQLPTELGGTTVEVNGRKAGLFFVSPGQINYVMPSATESGLANVVVKAGATISNGTVQVARVAPAIFTANSNGRGVPAASVLRVKTNGLQSFEPLSQYSASNRRFITKPIDMGPDGELVFLVLFLSGIHNSADDNNDGNFAENIRVLVGGIEVNPLFAGVQPDFVGLDQVNVLVPRSLIGRGIVNVSVTGLGYAASNVVDIEIAGSGGASPVQVSGFGSAPALAGTELLINGQGFSSVKEENLVRISGRDAEVISATSTQLRVMVPFGVETGTVSVRTLQGEGMSAEVLPVRTSISGWVENTLGQPLAGAGIRVILPDNSELTTSTNTNGSFVLADVPEGFHTIEFDGGTIPTTPPYPQTSRKLFALKNRDNQFPSHIALQQNTGNSGTVGGGSFAGLSSGYEFVSQTQPEQQAITIQTDDFQLIVPSDVKVTTPNGGNTATLTLTPLKNSRTPVELPLGVFSTSIVQITPFNVTMDPGAKLVFPNTDGFPAGARLVLFRYDQAAGAFVPDSATVSVSADGQRIETEDGAIKVTSYYFASLVQSTTTVVGRVVEADRKTPVPRALVRLKGREAFTDGNGSYVLRYVPVREGENLSVDVGLLRPSARVDREVSASSVAAIGGITKMPDVILPGEKDNRPPTIIAPPKVSVDEGKRVDVAIVVTDPDPQQLVTLNVAGANFASIEKTQTASSAYVLRLTPNFGQAGEYTLTLTATDSLSASAKQEVTVIVNKVNRAPTVKIEPVTIDEDTTATIKIDATDPDGDRINIRFISQPASGKLTGSLPDFTYTPNLNFNGVDRFTVIASDGKLDSAPATAVITVSPVNDPPVINVPAAQSVNEGQLLLFSVSATDPDSGQSLTITATGLPEGANVMSTAPGTMQFRWTPNFNQSGNYTISFKATDNAATPLSDTKEVIITVNDVSLLSVPGQQVVNEGQTLLFDVSAPPGLPGPVTIQALELPEGAEISILSVNNAQFRWTPNIAQAGSYIATLKATINAPSPISETKIIRITVLDVVRDLSREGSPFSIWGAAGPLPQSVSDDGDALGTSVVTGDLNGDGISDVAVGAPGANGVGFDNGKVYVFFGRANLLAALDLAKDKADVEILGEAGGDRFGSTLAIGDVNGDGKNDLIIGAPRADSKDFPDAGKVYVVFGNLTGGTDDSITKLAGATIIGSQRSLRFGSSLAVGRIAPKNNTASDLIVGAPGFDVAGATAQLNDAGAVAVFFGGQDLTKTIDLSITPPNYLVTGTIAGGEIGTTLAAGDFNGDGLYDFTFGGPLANPNGLIGSGIVYLALGASNLEGVKNASQASSLMLFGAAEGDNLGSALVMGDLNGDGKSDLIVSSIGADAQGVSRKDVGGVFVIYGGTNLQGRPVDLTIVGAGANDDQFPDALGKTLAVGDFNGDGVVDLAIGAPGSDLIDSKRDPLGAVYVIYGSRSGLTGIYDLAMRPADWTVIGADPGDNLGGGAMAFGNINAAEPADIILGMPRGRSLNNTRIDAGEVRCAFGIRR